MDVTCDRCSTEYEFDAALISPRGTTVKCTQCGHLFKIHRPAASSVPEIGTHWTVRRANGENHQLPSLTELAQLIREGTFTRDDEVSRTGKAWKRLGDIEELEPFFFEADRRGPSRRRKPTQGLVVGLSAPKPAREPRANAERGADGPPAAFAVEPAPAAPVTQSWRARAPRGVPPGAEQPTAHAAPVSDDDDITTEQRPLPPRENTVLGAALAMQAPGLTDSRHTPVTAAGSQLPAIDTDALETQPIRAPRYDEALFEFERPRGSRWPWLFLVLSLATALGAWLLWRLPASAPEHASTRDPSGEFLSRADAAFASHRSEHFEAAITEYIKALAFHESDPHVLSSLSRVYAVWAQALRFAGADEGRSPQAKLQVARPLSLAPSAQVSKLAEQAKAYAETAARKNPGNVEAEVALSDALRLTGNLVAARSELDRALAADRNPSAEALRVHALLAIDEAKGDLRAGLRSAARAVALEPDLVRTQLLLARCLIADGDLEGARYHVRAVTTRDRALPSAARVQALIDAASQPAAAATPAPAATTPDAGAPQREPFSHEGYIARGRSLLESGQVGAAKRMFEQALFIKPNSAPAHTGLGYVALEKNRPQLAVQHFVAAARTGNEDALIGLGEAYRRLQRPKDALRAYQHYLAQQPSGRQAHIARAQIERLSEALASKKAP